MIINIIGECDKRPVLYTVMKICQTLGDVLLVTSSSRLIRLSDTGATYGHCQNTMIAVTHEGIDDFWEEFTYDPLDFNFIIVDNIVTAGADITLYVKGLAASESELDVLEYIENYDTIELYKHGLIDAKTLLRCEEFESLRTFCPISTKISSAVASILAKRMNVDVKKLTTIANEQTSTHLTKVPPVKKSGGFGRLLGKG